ncbi:hypothetical protein L1049_009145 [Liquidambar formosana]|uniref:Uncharacterized protein n=1 Tax=Liquidambar formosana TaxID=63359 RepID=A0AAP0X2R0_LIQFO
MKDVMSAPDGPPPQATFRHETDKVDKGRAAGAAADLPETATKAGLTEHLDCVGFLVTVGFPLTEHLDCEPPSDPLADLPLPSDPFVDP